jgi:Putative DNA-binding domain
MRVRQAMTMPGDGDEQRRQDALLRAVWAPSGAPADVDTAADPDLRLQGNTRSGLDAYRGHARAAARRAMVHAYPTVNAMLGEEAMAQLSWMLWQHQPPVQGDLGEWGEGLPALISGALATQSGTADMLAPWPWLADVARLDWARHRCERLRACPLDAASMALLTQGDPAEVSLVFQPHVIVLDADWPVDGLWRAHQLPADQQVAAAESALRGHAPQTVLLWWSDAPTLAGVQQRLLSPGQASWLRSLRTLSLGEALQQAPAAVDFGDWLQEALRQGWLLGAVMRQAG